MSSKDVRKLLRELNAIDDIVVEQGKRHFIIFSKGKRIGSLPTTPSDHRALKNKRSQLRRAGVPV